MQILQSKYDLFLERAKQRNPNFDLQNPIKRMIGKEDLTLRDDRGLNTSSELVIDFYVQWQFQKKEHQQMLDLYTNLQHRLKIVVQIREKLHSLLQSNESLTLDDAIIKEIHKQADQEDMRATDVIREASERSEQQKKDLKELIRRHRFY